MNDPDGIPTGRGGFILLRGGSRGGGMAHPPAMFAVAARHRVPWYFYLMVGLVAATVLGFIVAWNLLPW